ncbi:MAG: hypothetical protein EKK45_16965 [Curvibacter sp.]|nr:MAG: hypothetical protein EKK45_16965 [Curvibacter sp.]
MKAAEVAGVEKRRRHGDPDSQKKNAPGMLEQRPGWPEDAGKKQARSRRAERTAPSDARKTERQKRFMVRLA